MNIYAIGGIVLAVLAGAAFLFFKLYVGQVEETGSLKQSNTQLTTTVETKSNAVKQRGTIERKNSSRAFDDLVDRGM
jgi:membrane protein implicated in regulation of membrane protease activity